MKIYSLIIASTLLVLSLSSTFVVPAQSPTDENKNDPPTTGSITGRVVNENGQPLANAAVMIRTYGVGNLGRGAVTDNEGKFELTGLRPLAYLLAVNAPAYIQAPRDPDVNPIGYYRVGDSVTLQMIKGGVITGTVKKSGGDPVVRVAVRTVMIRDTKGEPLPYGPPMRVSYTDDRGVYRIYGLPPGTYVVSAGGALNANGYSVDPYANDAPTYAPSGPLETAAEISVNAGQETTDVDIRYRDEAGHLVSGYASLTIPDQTTGFQITLTRVARGVSQFGYSFYQQPGVRGFSFSGVADGDYDVTAYSFSPETGTIMSEVRQIKVRGADVGGIELIAKPLGSIAGAVVLEDSKLPECQGKRRPALGETVISSWHNEKTTAKDQPRFIWSLGAPVMPDPQGRFRLASLAAGQYRFITRPMAKYWYLKSIVWPAGSKAPQASQPFDAARYWTTLKFGERLSGLTITFAEGAASLRGQIDAGESQKLPSHLFVYLVPAERDKAEDVLRFSAALVSDDHSFLLQNLPPGHYRLVAATVSESDSNILSKLRLPDEGEMRAKLLRDSEVTKLDVELKPCQNLTDFHLPYQATKSQN
jgi:hypothetical protein